jgi:glycosyltransferase involved in cell wall biosynthesis
MPFLIEDNETGILVEKNDVNKMVQAILSICSNEKFADSLAANARKQVEEFDWNNVKSLWDSILQ